MNKREEFIKTIIKNPVINDEYKKQSGYYWEYIGDDWSEDMFRFDKSFFYEIFGKFVLNLIKEEHKNDDDFYEEIIEQLKNENNLKIFIDTK